MNIALQKAAEQALQLPADDRARLAEILAGSLEEEADFSISEAWLQEIRQRCQAIDHGEVELIPVERALAGLRDKYL